MAGLNDVIQMLEKFGFTASYIRSTLAKGDSAHNAFAGIQTELQLKWADLCMEASPATLAELKPVYEKLMGMKMKSRKTGAEVKAKKRKKVVRDIDNMMANVERRKRDNMVKMHDAVRAGLEKNGGSKNPETMARFNSMFGITDDD